jgi:hypothetical protein
MEGNILGLYKDNDIVPVYYYIVKWNV